MYKFYCALALLLFLGLIPVEVIVNILPEAQKLHGVYPTGLYWILRTLFTLAGGVAILVAVWAVWQYKIGTKNKKDAAGIKALMYVVTGLFIMALCWRMIDWLNVWIISIG